MTFDPVQPSWIAGLVAGLFYVVRIIDRKMQRSNPASVEHMSERISRLDEKVEGLVASNRHRRREIEELDYKLRQLGKRFDAESA